MKVSFTNEKSSKLPSDTVYYVIANNLLALHTDFVYNCCGLLNDSVVIGSEEVAIYITDTCRGKCSCYCMCTYSFVHTFKNFEQKNTHFNIYTKDLGLAEYVLWKNVVFVDALD